METSIYQSLKLQFIDIVGLSKDAVHIHIGLVIFFAAVLVWKSGKITPVCIIPVLLAALGMELIDLYDDVNSVGYMCWTNSLHDIINWRWKATTKLARRGTNFLLLQRHKYFAAMSELLLRPA